MSQYAIYDIHSGKINYWIDTEQMNINTIPQDSIEILNSSDYMKFQYVLEGGILSVSPQSYYYIDLNGNKWLENNSYQKLECNYSDNLVNINNVWRVITNCYISSQSRIATLNNQCQTNIFNGFTYPEPINGNTYTFTLSMTDQTNGLAAFNSAQGVIQNAKSWTASTNMVAFSSVIEVNGLYYVAYTSGTTGTTEPTFTSEFSTPIIDGTVTWYQYGILLGTTVGNVFFTAPQVISLFAYSVSYINGQRSAYTKAKNLLNQIANATSETVSTAYSLNSFIIDDQNNLYQCTTAGTSGSILPTYNTTPGGTTTDNTVVWTCLGSFTSYINSLTL
jgi:hypothetical protein